MVLNLLSKAAVLSLEIGLYIRYSAYPIFTL